MYDPGTTKKWKEAISLYAKQYAIQKENDWVTCEFSVEMEFILPRPQAHYRTGRFSHQYRTDAPYWHTKKPDLDNLSKTVLDAITVTQAFWHDDGQVSNLRLEKRYPRYCEASVAGVRITIFAPLTEPPTQ